MTDKEITYTLIATRKFRSADGTFLGWEPVVMKCENGKEVGIIGGLLPGMDAFPMPEEALAAAGGKETTFIDNQQGYRFHGDGTYHPAHVAYQMRFVEAVLPVAEQPLDGRAGDFLTEQAVNEAIGLEE